MGTSGGDSGSTETVEKKTEGGSPAPAPAATGVAAHRPAETLTALAGGLGATVTQLLDVENAAVISLLIALVGLLPALVTWLVELGKKWDGPAPAAGGNEAEAELAYLQAKLLREANMTHQTPKGIEAIKQVREAFGMSPASAPEELPNGTVLEAPVGTQAPSDTPVARGKGGGK